MADNINYNVQKGTYSFYSLKENPWHGLGTIVEEAETPDEILKIANMDYEVKLAPLYASFIPNDTYYIKKNDDNSFTCFIKDQDRIIIPKKGERILTNYATYRSDTYDVFGVVGNRYEPVQNSVAIDFIYEVLHSQDLVNPKDIVIETAGVLGKGERIFVTAKLPTYEIAGDEVNKYILFTTTHDGSGSITACFTNIRVVCNNTLNMALHSSTNKMYFKHTKNVKTRLSEGAKLMNKAINYSHDLKLELEQYSNITIREKDAIDYIQDLFLTKSQIEYVNDRGGFLNINTGDDVVPTRTLNRMTEVVNYIEHGVGQDLNYGTALWLYNGVTSYINNGTSYKNADDKFSSITDGWGAKLNQKAYEIMTNRFAA